MALDPWSITFWGWLLRKLWTPKPTHQVLGLPRPIAPQVLDALDAFEPDTPSRIADQIQEDAETALQKCLRERGVPDGVYELIIGDPASGRATACGAAQTAAPGHYTTLTTSST